MILQNQKKVGGELEIYEYLPGKAVKGDGYVIALGFFDGVHAAHRMLIGTAKKKAADKGLPLAVFTFRAEEGRLKSTPLPVAVLGRWVTLP